MGTGFARLAVALVCILGLTLPGYAGQLDDYYLAAFGEQSGSAMEKALLGTATETAGAVQCGTPLKHGLSRDWNLLEPATRKILAKQLSAPALTDETTLLSGGGHFLIHYATSGDDLPTPATGYTVSSWVQAVADTFENVYSQYMAVYGYHPPPGTPYNVYLRNLAPQKIYGQTTSTSSAPSPGFANAHGSYIEIDKDFTNTIFHPSLYLPLQSLQITAAHEYHHAIQYGYNFFFDIWYAEATSTWYEDEVYDGVNQLYDYLRASLLNTNLSLDIAPGTATGGGYGRWLFNRHLAETHGGQSFVRSIWESLATTAPSGQTDIPMLPIIGTRLQALGSSLSVDFLGYAGKLYSGAWSTHLSEIPLIPAVAMTAEFTTYPITVASIPSPAITLPHYGFAFFSIVPPAAAPTTLDITLTADPGISAVAFRKTGSDISTFTPAQGSGLITVPGFNTAGEVVLLLANTTTSDNLFGGFSTDGAPIAYTLQGTSILSATPATALPSVTLTWMAVAGASSYRIYRSSVSSTSLTLDTEVTATSFTDSDVVTDHTYYYAVMPVAAAGTGPASQVTSVKVTTSAASSGGGGGGCFIATAAYGSYLHPQVRLLREFRDRYLLTNAPGRAFVALYYRFSPPLADVIARHGMLRVLTRLLLTPVVMAVAHPVMAGAALLLAGGLCIRRRYKAAGRPLIA